MKKLFFIACLLLASKVSASVTINGQCYDYLWNPFTGTNQYVNCAVSSSTLPSGSTQYIQNTLTPTTTTQQFSVQTSSVSLSLIDYGAFQILRDITGTGLIDTYYGGPSFLTGLFQIDANVQYGMVYSAMGNNFYSIWQQFHKSRSPDGNTRAIVQNGDELGRFNFLGDNGVDDYLTGAEIIVNVDGTPSASEIPGNINFYVTPFNNLLVKPILSLRSMGNVGIATNTYTHRLTVAGDAIFSSSVTANSFSGQDATINSNLIDYGSFQVLRDILGTDLTTDYYGSLEALTGIFQINAGVQYGMAYNGFGNNNFALWQEYRKSRSTDGNTPSMLFNNDEIGRFNFLGDDGTGMNCYAANMIVKVDGDTSFGDNLRGKIDFHTAPFSYNGGFCNPDIPTLSLKNNGNISIATNDPATHRLTVAGDGIFSSSVTIGDKLVVDNYTVPPGPFSGRSSFSFNPRSGSPIATLTTYDDTATAGGIAVRDQNNAPVWFLNQPPHLNGLFQIQKSSDSVVGLKNRYTIAPAGTQQFLNASGTAMVQFDPIGNSSFTIPVFTSTITVGSGIYISTRTNAMVGLATLSGGTITVNNTRVTANTLIMLTDQNGGLNIGSPYISARTPGTSFVITSTNVLDSSPVAWILIEPVP